MNLEIKAKDHTGKEHTFDFMTISQSAENAKDFLGLFSQTLSYGYYTDYFEDLEETEAIDKALFFMNLIENEFMCAKRQKHIGRIN